MDRSLNLLDEALGLAHRSRVSLSPGYVVLIEDCVETSGAFVLHHLIKRTLSLEDSGVVLFVALAHPFSHYDRILRKLVMSKQGCNLVSQKEHGRFVFFNMLKLECPDGDKGNITEDGLVELYRKIQKAVEVSMSLEHSRSCITIMIDDISLMEVAAHGSLNRVLDFLHYCHTLTAEIGCSLVILNHDDIYSNTVVPTLILQMEYDADIVIKAEPLVTGLATDVHGQLTVLNKRILDEYGNLRNKIHNFHFKIKENGVEYFHPGNLT